MRIADKDAITRLIKRIEAISPDGDMMKSLVVDERLQLEFDCENGTTVINIYDGRFKTPSTGFNSSRKDKEIEAQIYDDLKSLFSPAVGEPILLVQGLALELPRFFGYLPGYDSPFTAAWRARLSGRYRPIYSLSNPRQAAS